MLDLLQSFFYSAGFIFCAGMLLLVAFFWYLSAEVDSLKRGAGSIFIVGVAAFSILSLFDQGINYGIDIKGGSELTLEVQPKIDEATGKQAPPSQEDMQQACDILNDRLNSSGTSEVQIIHSGNKILIQIPQQSSDDAVNKERLDAMVTMLTKMAKLELLAVHPNSNAITQQPEVLESIKAYEARKEAHLAAVAANPMGKHRKLAHPRIPASLGLTDYMILEHPVKDQDGKPFINKQGKEVIDYIVLLKPYAAMQQGVYVTGKDVVDARPNALSHGQADVVLSNEGAKKMRHLTSNMAKGVDRLAVVLNSVVKSAPSVNDVLGKKFQITGLDAPGETLDISKALANPLSSDLVVEGRKDVSAQLGKSALTQGIWAGIVGYFAVFGFCFWYYRSTGIIAMVGLSINILILLGLMSLFGFVLTLPGIAGIVLTMGVAVDANVLIYERLREEKQLGRDFLTALRNSYDKAFSAIFDSNVTSLITAVILFWLASGSIKGFAVTTCVGIVTSMIGAIVVTRVLFYWADHFGVLTDSHFSRPPLDGVVFDFMGMRKICMIASGSAILLMALYAGVIQQDKALGIDFVGGSTLTYIVPESVDVSYEAMDKQLHTLKLSKIPNAQEMGVASDRNFKIRCANAQEAAFIDADLRATVPNMDKLPVPSVDNISASLGSTFFITAVYALAAGLLGITVYLSLRFEWSFAMGALVAIAHDILFVIGMVILFGTELNIIHVGAFLTVAGYSINDTIVIYDRIREQLHLAEPNEKLSDIMNEAINQTLPRTILTGLSSVAVLIALCVLGGPAMKDFSVTMLIGMFVGTYSSVFIAAPVVLFFARKHDIKDEVRRAARVENDQTV